MSFLFDLMMEIHLCVNLNLGRVIVLLVLTVTCLEN